MQRDHNLGLKVEAMKYFVTAIALVFLISCKPPPEEDITRPLDPYDPEKAGAIIAESIDITDSIKPYESFIGRSYDMAVYNNKLYIRFAKLLKIFDLANMKLERELELELELVPNYYPGGYSDSFGYIGNGLVITDDFALFIFNWSCNDMPPDRFPQILSLDLSTGKITNNVPDKIIGNEFKTGYYAQMGYDKVYKLLWFWRGNGTESSIHFYSFDKEDKRFVEYSTINDFPVGWKMLGKRMGTVIHGSEIWNSYWGDYKNDSGIVRRNLNNPQEVLHKIDINYLGLDTYSYNVPSRFIYIEPYIYIIVMDYEKVKMLKLLPNN